MMMMGLHFMDQVPFKHVYLHALVRDAQGRKMSKSTGNVIDPLVMIEKYGTDALRFTLTAFAAMGRDIRLSEDRIEGYRHFVNKLWNASRFALMNLPEDVPAAVELDKVQGLHHQWLLHRLEEVKKDVDGAIEAYRFNDAAQTLYKFLWNEFCDWYLELIKPDMKEEGPRKTEAQYVLWTALREFLILMHPIMPFVTAEIWQALPGGAGSDAAVQLLPEARPGCLKPEAAARMEFVQEVIGMIRTIRAELEQAVRAANIANPDAIDNNALELMKTGVLSPADYAAFMERFDSNPTMLKLVGHYAAEAAKTTDSRREAAALNAIALDCQSGEGAVMRAWDSISAISDSCGDGDGYRRKSPGVIVSMSEKWDDLAGEAVENF